MAQVIIGKFENQNAARAALEGLQSRGFSRDQISYLEREDASDTATRATLGGASGVVLGLAALAIPGIGPVIAAGPIVAALAGGAAGATGGLIGSLIQHAKGDGIIVAVHSDRADIAEDVMRQYHAIDVSRHQHSEHEEPAEVKADPHAEPDNFGSNGGSSQWGQRVLHPDGSVADRTVSRDADPYPGTENPHKD